MENTYGIGVTNRYALFLDDEETDPLEALKLKEQEKELKKKTKVEKENKGKTEVLPKGKQPTVQKKVIKEASTFKIQENKREGKKSIYICIFYNRTAIPSRFCAHVL